MPLCLSHLFMKDIQKIIDSLGTWRCFSYKFGRGYREVCPAGHKHTCTFILNNTPIPRIIRVGLSPMARARARRSKRI